MFVYIHIEFILSQILQVSCHRCIKAIKIASKSEIIQCKRKLSVLRTWMTKNKSDRLHNKGCHLKGQYNVMLSCTKGLSIQTNKRMATSASLCEGPIFYFYVFTFMERVKVFLLPIFSSGKHHVVRKDLGTYVQVNMKEICPRCNNKVVIYISLYHDKCLLFMLELY